MADPSRCLQQLVKIPGITGREEQVVEAAAEICAALNLSPRVSPEGIVFTIEGDQPGPTLAYCSHLDTVPAGDGWTVPPHEARIVNGLLYGRGAVDARASCVAIILTAHHFVTGGLARGRLVGILSIGEEGNDPSLPALLDALDRPDAAVVGEPTAMNIAVAQRGLMVLELTAKGTQQHAARSAGENPLLTLAQDLLALDQLRPSRRHETLGSIRVTPTRMNAGVADNVVPSSASAILDIRTTPAYGIQEIEDLIRERVRSEVRVLADKWVPCEIRPDHPLVISARAALPDAAVFPSDATSDWVFFTHKEIPAVKIGPGDSGFSHKPDERISIKDLEAGLSGYIAIARSFLEPAESIPKAGMKDGG